MFEQVLITEAPGGKRFWTTCAGVTSQVALVAAMILAPMVWPEALPKPSAFLTLLLPPVPAPPPPARPVDVPRVARTVATHSIVNPDGTINVPRIVPKTVAMIVDEAPPSPPGMGVPGGTGAPGTTGVAGAFSSLFNTVLPPPPVTVVKPVEKAPAPAAEIPRLSIGGVVLQGKLISKVEPVYPPLARQMRVQGTVELLAVVGTDGRIRELRLLSGNPLLAPAAVDAVKRWVYQTTFLNSSPVEVMAPVTVNFKLN